MKGLLHPGHEFDGMSCINDNRAPYHALQMHSAGVKPDVSVDPTLFTEVYRSQYGMVRVYQILNVSNESKAWIADPANRKCDAPGSWYCVGQYPPALERRESLIDAAIVQNVCMPCL